MPYRKQHQLNHRWSTQPTSPSSPQTAFNYTPTHPNPYLPSYPTTSAHINPNTHHPTPFRPDPLFTSTHHTYPIQTLLNPPRPISTLSNVTPTHLRLYSTSISQHYTLPYSIPTLPTLTNTHPIQTFIHPHLSTLATPHIHFLRIWKIIFKPHAHFQTIEKIFTKFQKDW